MKSFPLHKAFQLLEPGPLVLLSTFSPHYKNKYNVMAMSWHTVMEFTPQIGCVVSSNNFSFAALRSTKECVISIPTVDIANTVVDIGNCTGRRTDKFKKFDLTALPAKKVKAPLIQECLAHIECKVIDDRLADEYCFFILEGVKAWIDEKRKETRRIHANGDGTFVVDGETLNLRKRMTKWKDTI